MSELSRREALQSIGLLCCGAFISPLLVSCSVSKQVFLREKDNLLTLSTEEFEGIMVVLRSRKYNYPIALSRSENGEFTALLMQCTHKGCELNMEGSYLVCPCHGSEFDSQGKVLNPPADKALRTFPVRTDANNIYIDIS